MAAAVLLAAAADVSADPSSIGSVVLGNSFQYVCAESDRGLTVTVWKNIRLGREEAWHNAGPGGWFVRVREGMYVMALFDPKTGSWRTSPSNRLVFERGEWKRIGNAKASRSHTVGPGDSLWKIARQFAPDRELEMIQKIIQANRLPPEASLRAGWVLVIPE